MPPIVYPAPAEPHVFGTVSVVLIASAAAAPPSAEAPPAASSTPGSSLSMRQPLADEAGGADRDLARADTDSTLASRSAV